MCCEYSLSRLVYTKNMQKHVEYDGFRVVVQFDSGCTMCVVELVVATPSRSERSSGDVYITVQLFV